jgi:Predicted N-acetylglucosaminyl transferase
MTVRRPGKLADSILFAVLFCAVAIGWLFGRAASTRHRMQPRSSDYYKGLNYLLDAKPDAEMDTFIASLDVNEETFETHMALGHLLRKKGEVQRAIRVHQNLLNASDIAPYHQHSAHLELARDYISAGLLDRAEHLLLDLISESPQRAVEARRYLIEIYQTEREWEKAAAMASSLLSKKVFLGVSKPTCLARESNRSMFCSHTFIASSVSSNSNKAIGVAPKKLLKPRQEKMDRM